MYTYLALFWACGFGFCEVDHVVATFGDCCWALGVDSSGWNSFNGSLGSGTEVYADRVNAGSLAGDGARSDSAVRLNCVRSSDMVIGKIGRI